MLPYPPRSYSFTGHAILYATPIQSKPTTILDLNTITMPEASPKKSISKKSNPKSTPQKKPQAKLQAKAMAKRKTPAPPAFEANGMLTLSTDFGYQDAYVPAMKGVILSRFPEVRLVDLSHEIPAQSILGGALFLADAMPFFPAGTVHLVVVDPGVGSERKAIVAQANDQLFVCPDNGLLSLLFEEHPLQTVREITNPEIMRPEISNTFHGRDIFAPVAARLAQGMPLETLGPELQQVVMLEIHQPVSEGDLIQGEVIYIDHFGNCITNIHQDILQDKTAYRVQFAATTITDISMHYAAAPLEEVLALFGSSGRLELAVRDGNAAEEFEIRLGAPVTLFIP